MSFALTQATTLEAYRADDWDFVKFNPRATYFAEAWGNTYEQLTTQRQLRLIDAAVQEASGMAGVMALDPREGVFREHLLALWTLIADVGNEVDVLQTMFLPLSVVAMLCGSNARFLQFAAADARAAHAALDAAARTAPSGTSVRSTFSSSGVWGDGGQNLLDRGVLSREVCLDLLGFFQDGSCVVVGSLGAGIRGSRLNVLADDDDRQEHHLQERLSDPSDDDDRIAGLERGGSADQSEEREEIGAPHRANDKGDLQSDLGVEASDGAGAMDLGDGRCHLRCARLLALFDMRVWDVIEDRRHGPRIAEPSMGGTATMNGSSGGPLLEEFTNEHDNLAQRR